MKITVKDLVNRKVPDSIVEEAVDRNADEYEVGAAATYLCGIPVSDAQARIILIMLKKTELRRKACGE